MASQPLCDHFCYFLIPIQSGFAPGTRLSSLPLLRKGLVFISLPYSPPYTFAATVVFLIPLILSQSPDHVRQREPPESVRHLKNSDPPKTLTHPCYNLQMSVACAMRHFCSSTHSSQALSCCKCPPAKHIQYNT